MEDYIHIYKIPRSYTQETEENRDSRTESFLDNRKSRHDYEPVNFDRGESGTSQRPQVDDENLQETKNSEKKYIKQQIRRSFCIYSIIVAIALSSLMVLVTVSLIIIAIRSNAVGDQVADIQQQFEELQLYWNQEWSRCNISFMVEMCSMVTANKTNMRKLYFRRNVVN